MATLYLYMDILYKTSDCFSRLEGIYYMNIYPYAGCPIRSCTWVELTLMLVFIHLAQLPSRFSQIPISPGIVG